MDKRYQDRDADDAHSRAAAYDEMRARWEADLVALTKLDKQTTICLGDAMNALQDASAALFMAAVHEVEPYEQIELKAERDHQRQERPAA